MSANAYSHDRRDETATPLCGAHRPNKTNPLLIKPLLGCVKATVYDLPSAAGNLQHEYGLPQVRDGSSSAEVVGNWAQHDPNHKAQAGRDFKQLNKHAVVEGVINCKQMQEYRKTHDYRLKLGSDKVPEQKPYDASTSFGRPTNASTSFNDLFSHSYRYDWVAALTQPKLCAELQALESSRKYMKYVAVVEALVLARVRAYGAGDLEKRLWVQAIVTCNAFGVRSVEEKKFGTAMELLKKAQQMTDHHETVPTSQRPQLVAFIHDSYAYFYYRRGKFNAALQSVNKAMRTHLKREEWAHVAKCHLHTGTVLAKLKKHDESVRCMGQVLAMVEDHRLEAGGASAQKICLVAVCYHNIAVEQLYLRRFTEACVSSQNARRLARLSMSYSNKWLKAFESTHKSCLGALAAQNQRDQLDDEQKALFKNLTRALYS